MQHPPLKRMYTPGLFNSLKNKTHNSILEIWKKITVVTRMEKPLPGAIPQTAIRGGNIVTFRPVTPLHPCQNFPIPQVRMGHESSLGVGLLCSCLASSQRTWSRCGPEGCLCEFKDSDFDSLFV